MYITWQAELNSFEDEILWCTLSEEELNKEFDDGYGGHSGAAFTAWSKNWVYFPIVYDGAEWIGNGRKFRPSSSRAANARQTQ